MYTLKILNKYSKKSKFFLKLINFIIQIKCYNSKSVFSDTSSSHRIIYVSHVDIIYETHLYMRRKYIISRVWNKTSEYLRVYGVFIPFLYFYFQSNFSTSSSHPSRIQWQEARILTNLRSRNNEEHNVNIWV